MSTRLIESIGSIESTISIESIGSIESTRPIESVGSIDIRINRAKRVKMLAVMDF